MPLGSPGGMRPQLRRPWSAGRLGDQGANREVADAHFGSKADLAARPSDVRSTPESGHHTDGSVCPQSAKSGNHPSLDDKGAKKHCWKFKADGGLVSRLS
jgi:hypothetical protein